MKKTTFFEVEMGLHFYCRTETNYDTTQTRIMQNNLKKSNVHIRVTQEHSLSAVAKYRKTKTHFTLKNYNISQMIRYNLYSAT